MQPLFPFGHGLSYSTFNFSGLAVEGAYPNITVSLTVANVAGPPGREVPQLYLQGPLPGDAMALKGFANTGEVGVGGAAIVSIALSARELSFFDEGVGAWAPYPPGEYDFAVGASSADLRLFGSFRV